MVGFRADGRTELTKSLREGWWEKMSKPWIALALGSRGLRGMAHIGVLRALAEAEIQPTDYAGSSAGALAPIVTPVH